MSMKFSACTHGEKAVIDEEKKFSGYLLRSVDSFVEILKTKGKRRSEFSSFTNSNSI